MVVIKYVTVVQVLTLVFQTVFETFHKNYCAMMFLNYPVFKASHNFDFPFKRITLNINQHLDHYSCMVLKLTMQYTCICLPNSIVLTFSKSWADKGVNRLRKDVNHSIWNCFWVYRKETNDWLKFYDFQTKNEIQDQENTKKPKNFHKIIKSSSDVVFEHVDLFFLSETMIMVITKCN